MFLERINNLAKQILETARKRGKVQDDTIVSDIHLHIANELSELVEATFDGKPSEVVPFSHEEEEAADIIIATLSYLEFIGCSDIEGLIMSKVEFNKTRYVDSKRYEWNIMAL